MNKTIRGRWTGDELRIIDDDMAWCNENFVIGMIYRVEPVFQRDHNLNASKFAALSEAYKQLPERYGPMFKNFDHFRKYLLVAEGYCTTRDLVFENAYEAARNLPFIESVCSDNPHDKEFAFVERNDSVIRVTHPRSMSPASMKPTEFREAANKMIERAATMIGVSVSDLRSNAGRAA